MWFLLLLCLPCLVQQVNGHGRLLEPPSRASMWRFGFKNPTDNNDNQGYCGGKHQPAEGAKCGICGDPWDASPRQHEAPGGKFANGIIVRNYTAGQNIKVTAHLTANHKGYMTFKLCANNNVKQDPKQDCFDATPLEIVGGGTRFPVAGKGSVKMDVTLKLPNIQCTQCILQWTYRAGNSWHACPASFKEYPNDCGDQETFRACSDISISGGAIPTQPPTTTTKAPTTTPSPTTKASTTTRSPITTTKASTTTRSPITTTKASTTTTRSPITTTKASTTTTRPPITTTPKPKPGSKCVGVGLYAGYDAISRWCTSNCHHNPPNCPADVCHCGNNPREITSPLTCIATGPFAGDSALTNWCQVSCNHSPPHCPKSYCQCGKLVW